MTLTEHIDDIRESLEKGELPPNEAAVCDDIVRRIIHELDWPRYQSQIVYPQYPVEGGKVDFALCHPPSEPCVFIEVKQVGGIESADAEEQLFRYAFRRGVPIAVLTDGREWHFFYPIGQGDYRERKVHEMDLTEGDSEENAKRLNRYLNYKSIQAGEAIEAIKKDYDRVIQQRQVSTRLPEAWSKLVEDEDEFLLHTVAEKTESLCGYRPTDEQVLGFLKSLKREIKSKNGGCFSSQNPGLFVTMPNEETVNHKVSATTFAEVIEKLGVEQVRNLELIVNSIPLVSTFDHPTYNQHQSGRYYITTHSSTKAKKRLLEEIAERLGIKMKVEIVDKS